MRGFVFPTQSLVFGPNQIVARINQDQAISPQITLWNQQGSQVDWGTLMVIPVEESLIYVRPLYLRSSGGQIPELRRVVVAHDNQIVMEPTLDAALRRLFDGAVSPFTGPDPEVLNALGPATAEPQAAVATGGVPAAPTGLALQAQQVYERAVAAQRIGDWAAYGVELERLGTILAQLQQQQP
jgi:hypothetical protein